MNILLCYDASDSAKKAMAVAVSYAGMLSAQIHVAMSLVGGMEKHVAHIDRAKEELAAASAVIKKAGIQCQTHLLIQGMAAGDTLTEFARDHGMDLIILGIEKTSKVGKLVFGSTAQFVILESACPVMTVKSDQTR